MTAGQPLDGVRILVARTDAGDAVRDAAARPPRCRGRQDRASRARRPRPRLAPGDDGSRGSPRRGDVPAQQPRQAQRRDRPAIRRRTSSSCCDSRRDSTSSARTSRPGALDRLGLGYDDVAAVHPSVVYVSISGFGNRQVDGRGVSPYASWPAYAAVAEAMSGLYEWNRREDEPPRPLPAGRARRHRLRDVRGRRRCSRRCASATHRCRPARRRGDVRRDDRVLGRGDELLVDGRPQPPADAWSGDHPRRVRGGRRLVHRAGRPRARVRTLANLVGRPEWLDDERLARAPGGGRHIDVIREGVNAWTADKSSVQACHELAAAGIAAGPVLTAQQVLDDPHVAQRHMIVEIERTDDGPDPIAVPGNPVKLSAVRRGARDPPAVARRAHRVGAARRARPRRRRARRPPRRRCHQLTPSLTGCARHYP